MTPPIDSSSYSTRDVPFPEPTNYDEAMKNARKSIKNALCELKDELPLTIKKHQFTSSANHKGCNCPGCSYGQTLWVKIENIFNSVRNDNRIQEFQKASEKLRKVIEELIKIGIPFQQDKELNFWSTEFAGQEADLHAIKNNRTTDRISMKQINKLFLKWPEKGLPGLSPLITRSRTPIPQIANLFWSTVSDFYLETMKAGSVVYVFFQDAIIVGNFFWNVELPKLREKGVIVYFYVYDTITGTWKDPILMDSDGCNEISLRRRAIHPDDKPREKEIDSSLGSPLWRIEFRDGPNSASPIVNWRAPSTLTWGKLHFILKKIIYIHRIRQIKKFKSFKIAYSYYFQDIFNRNLVLKQVL